MGDNLGTYSAYWMVVSISGQLTLPRSYPTCSILGKKHSNKNKKTREAGQQWINLIMNNRSIKKKLILMALSEFRDIGEFFFRLDFSFSQNQMKPDTDDLLQAIKNVS